MTPIQFSQIPPGPLFHYRPLPLSQHRFALGSAATFCLVCVYSLPLSWLTFLWAFPIGFLLWAAVDAWRILRNPLPPVALSPTHLYIRFRGPAHPDAAKPHLPQYLSLPFSTIQSRRSTGSFASITAFSSCAPFLTLTLKDVSSLTGLLPSPPDNQPYPWAQFSVRVDPKLRQLHLQWISWPGLSSLQTALSSHQVPR